MNTLKRILCVLLSIYMLNSTAYGLAEPIKPPDESEIKSTIEEKYGINIILPEDEKDLDYYECMLVLERSLRMLPQGMIKEITDSYEQKGIETNVVINKTEKISDLFSEYVLTNNSATIYINTLQSSLYNDTCVASEESTVYELGHLIRDYIYDVYGYDKLKNDFLKFNESFEYGKWDESYSLSFINKHSALSFEHEIADLIWYTEVHPEYLRNISGGENEIIHEKIKYLADIFDQCFSSITADTRLWKEAVPQEPDKWAEETITTMKSVSLIPEEFEGIYSAYITKENFYTIAMNVIERKLGTDKFSSNLNWYMQEEYVTLDPVNGKIFLDDGRGYVYTDNLLCSNIEGIYKAYQMGLISLEGIELEPDDYITRLEAAKLFSYIANELGMDISEYDVAYYNDIDNVKESDKPFIYFATSKGILKGYKNNFNPYGYCTYQETCIMMMRLYNIL